MNRIGFMALFPSGEVDGGLFDTRAAAIQQMENFLGGKWEELQSRGYGVAELEYRIKSTATVTEDAKALQA